MRKMIDLLCYILYIFLIPHLIVFFTSNKETKSLISSDVQEQNKRTHQNHSLLYYLITNRYFRSFFYYRIGKTAKIVKWYLPGERTFLINNTTVIGKNVYLAHPYATVINAKKIGDNFVCRQCTTIGNKQDGRNDLVPQIGNNVVLGANVTIIGNISIGNNCTIGAGAVIVSNIPDNSVVVGNPGRVIRIIK